MNCTSPCCAAFHLINSWRLDPVSLATEINTEDVAPVQLYSEFLYSGGVASHCDFCIDFVTGPCKLKCCVSHRRPNYNVLIQQGARLSGESLYLQTCEGERFEGDENQESQSIGSMEVAKNCLNMATVGVYAVPVPYWFWSGGDERWVQISPATHHMSIMDPWNTDTGVFQQSQSSFSNHNPLDPWKWPKTVKVLSKINVSSM